MVKQLNYNFKYLKKEQNRMTTFYLRIHILMKLNAKNITVSIPPKRRSITIPRRSFLSTFWSLRNLAMIVFSLCLTQCVSKSFIFSRAKLQNKQSIYFSILFPHCLIFNKRIIILFHLNSGAQSELVA